MYEQGPFFSCIHNRFCMYNVYIIVTQIYDRCESEIAQTSSLHTQDNTHVVLVTEYYGQHRDLSTYIP